ncbi:MAG: class I tRNA ligase family protein, partial [Candidatus Andersenbacteria bacterium]
SDPSTMINPNDLIERHGADATRFGLAYNIQYDSQTIPFDEQAVVLGRNFANKLWNLARLLESLPERETATVADQWIEGRLHAVNQELQTLIEQYKVGEATRLLHDFVWDDFADWYMEILKVDGSTVVARRVYVVILQLLHPFMPFITEYLWQHLGQEGLLVRAAWPTTRAAADTDKEMNRFKEVVTTIRSARALLELPFKQLLTITISDDVMLPAVIEKITNTKKVSYEKVGAETIQWPLQHARSPLILGVTQEVLQQNIPKARTRLQKQLQEVESYIQREKVVLQQMQDKAPAASVAAKQESIRQAEAERQKIQESLQLLP